MKTNTRKGGVRGAAAVLAAMSGFAVCAAAHGQLSVTSDFTQNGGVLFIPNAPNTISINGAGNPTLRLRNGATSNNATRVEVGRQVGQSGTLILEENSVMTTVMSGLINPRFSIGEVAGSTGTVRVRTGALLNHRARLDVGDYGNGTLIVEQGGRVMTESLFAGGDGIAQGTILVTGENSRIDIENPNFSGELFVGTNGNQGTMIVSDGAVVTAGGDARIGFDTSGVLTVFDAGSSLVLQGELRVGVVGSGQGTVNVSHGAQLISRGGVLGERASSGLPLVSGHVTVSGAGSLWSNLGALTIATNTVIGPADFPSTGSLTVSNGGNVVSTGAMMVGRTAEGGLNVTGGGTISAVATDANFPYAAVLGFTDTATGTANISGAGSAMNLNGSIIVGNSGVATLNISNGGLVTNNEASLGFFQSSVAFATVQGANSRWLSTGNVYVGGNFSQQNNHLHGGQVNLLVRDGGLVRGQGSAGVTIFQESTLYGAGGTIMGNTVENRGTVIVGEPGERGFMTIAGNYRQRATGELNVTLAGLTAGTGYDRLVVTNQAFLDGELNVYVHPDFTLGYNQVFDILTSNSVLSGQFYELDNDALVGTFNGIDLFIRYVEVEGSAGNSGVVRLYTSSCSRCAADYNQDGGIDGADVDAFFADWEQGYPCSDVNLDGGIDGADVDYFFSVWENGGC